MKTPEVLQTALKVKQIDLESVRLKIADIDAWIQANNVWGTEQPATFLEKLLTEKNDLRTRQIQLEEQIKFINWCLQ